MSKLPVPGRLLTFLAGWPRRAAALTCLFGAVFTLVTGAHRRPGSVPVVVAAHVLAAGSTLRVEDLRVIQWPNGSTPPATARSPDQLVGRRTAAVIAAGMPVGGGTLLEPAIAQALAAGQVAATVRLANSDELAIIRAGSYVDLFSDDAGSAALVEGKSIGGNAGPGVGARAVLVLGVLAPLGQNAGSSSRTLIVAADRATAAKLSAHPAATFVATLVQPP